MIDRLEGSTFIFQKMLAIKGLEDTQGVYFLNRLTALADIEFPVDVLQVSFDGCGWNKHFVSNFLVAQPLGQQLQDVEFAIGQGLNQRLGTGRGGVLEGGIGNGASGLSEL